MSNSYTTYSPKLNDIQKQWWVIDARDLVLGRLAVIIADYLRGKHKPSFAPHADMGDYIVVVNADKVHLTGRKVTDRLGKIYYWHTGYAGGIKETTAKRLMEGPHAARIIQKAVQRMITRGPLGRKQMSHLFVYAGEEHPHAAQQPAPLDVAAMHVKNKKRVVKQ